MAQSTEQPSSTTRVLSMPLSPLGSITQNLTEFSLFPKIPNELQDMIWAMACYEPRIVEVAHTNSVGLDPRGSRFTCPLYSKTIVPAVLHTCERSRKIGLMHYKNVALNGSPSGSYINWSLDHLFMHGVVRSVGLEPLQKIKNNPSLCIILEKCRRLLVLPADYLCIDTIFLLSQMPKLEEVAMTLASNSAFYCYSLGDLKMKDEDDLDLWENGAWVFDAQLVARGVLNESGVIEVPGGPDWDRIYLNVQKSMTICHAVRLSSKTST